MNVSAYTEVPGELFTTQCGHQYLIRWVALQTPSSDEGLNKVADT